MCGLAQGYTHAVGFDDAPFPRGHRGDVLVLGVVYSGDRLEGVLSTRVRRDGINSTDRLIACLAGSRFRAQLQVVLLQGIAFAGFNVIDVHRLHRATDLPVIVAVRRSPNLAAIRRALLEKVPGGARKWALIEAAGPVEPVAGIYMQRVGIGTGAAASLIAAWQLHGKLPEPLRSAHLIAGGVVTGESRHRP
jgi:endonuclease V-like protein UPF0215 family